MAGLIITQGPASEPISLKDAKNYLKVTETDDDALIGVLITAAREEVENFCSRSFAVKSYLQTMDAFPFYADTSNSQQAYPPSYYSYPLYATNQWNYSQMIKLYMPPAIAVQGIDYTASDNSQVTLVQGTDFILDNVNEPSRIFPKPGSMWPPCAYTPNAVRIRFTAGRGSAVVDPSPILGEVAKGAGGEPIPGRAIMAMYQLLSGWYENRESITPGTLSEMPNHVKMLLWSLRIMDMQPTRG
jgi:hypothetical protein